MMKISIIMPVYNAELFVRRMLDSLKAQTLTDFEVLMIDDGSTDDSGAILDEYAATDSRFKVVHMQNCGVSAARQTGLELANGEYVIHADSDDWVEPTMLEELYEKAKQDDADVVICDFYSNTRTSQQYITQQPSSFDSQQVLFDLFQQLLYGSCWNKLVKRSYYNEVGAKFFANVDYCEDLLFCVQLFKCAEVKVVYLNRAFYHYWQNENSVTHNVSRRTFEGALLYLKKIEEILPEDKYLSIREKSALGIFVMGFIGCAMSNSEIYTMFRSVRNIAFRTTKSFRWKLGFFFIDCGFYKLAHKLIHY